MSRTTGRTMELLGLLHSGRNWTGTELTARLGVSDRTLRRDVEDLRSLGYGIDATRGAGGGYRLGVGAALPPLILTAEEAVAVGVGVLAASHSGIAGLDQPAARALAKLEISLSSEARERISLVADAVIHIGSGDASVDLDALTAVARAVRESRSLRIDYRRADGELRRRTVEPHRIVRTAERWYLIARDADADRWRTLRLDRLVPRSPFGARFRPRAVPDEEVRRFASWSLAVAPYPVRTTVRMHAPLDEVRRRFPPDAARLTDLGDGTTRVEAGAPDAQTLRAWLDLPGVRWEHVDGDDVRTRDGTGNGARGGRGRPARH